MNTITIDDISEFVEAVGPTLVAAVSANRNRTIATLWLSGEASPTDDEAERLTVALELFRAVAISMKSTDLARAWLIGDNTPDYGMPVMALRVADFAAARASAIRLIEDVHS